MSAVVTYNDSVIKNMSLEVADNGTITITVVGDVLDDAGGDPVTRNLVFNWKDLPATVKDSFNIVMKHLSQGYNVRWIAENKDSWPVLSGK